MIPTQKHFFGLPHGVTYLNCCYMSPQLLSVTEAGRQALQRKARPWNITVPDFFEESEETRGLFSKLVEAEPDDIAFVPSASYGIAVAARNLKVEKNSKIIMLQEQFPSNVLTWEELAKEQGYLSHDDVEESLPGKKPDQKQLDQVYTELRKHEVRIVDQADVDSVLPGGREERDVAKEKEKDKLDILDDPVRMYLKQMGQVPLLTREQEVEISKRIEDAENEVKRIIYSFGFTGKEHVGSQNQRAISIAKKNTCIPEHG